jgi:hypothetical protein
MIFNKLGKAESTKVYVTGQKLFAFDTMVTDTDYGGVHFQDFM